MDGTMSQVELAIQQLYSSLAPGQVQRAQVWLQTLQKQPQAWNLALQCLNSQSPNTRFYGSQTLAIKIVQDWESLTEEERSGLRDELLKQVTRASNGPRFVLTKLCVALTEYAIRACPSTWQNCIQYTSQYFSTQAQQSNDPAIRLALQCALVEWLTVLAEEAQRQELPAKLRASLDGELLLGVPVALTILEEVLDIPQEQTTEPIKSLKIQAFKATKGWVHYGIPTASMGQMFYKMMEQMSTPLWPLTIDVIEEIVTNPRMAGYDETISNGLLNAVTAGPIHTEFKRALSEGDDESSVKICQLLIEFGEHYATFLICNLLRQDVTIYMDMLLAYSQYPGVFAVDEEISDLPLTVWSNFQETLQNADILPLATSDKYDLTTNPHTGAPISSEEASKSSRRVPDDQVTQTWNTAQALYAKLVNALILKMAFSTDAHTWSADERERFRVYRRECSDALLVCYYILRQPALDNLVKRAVALTAQFSPQHYGIPQELESVLWGITAFSEAVSAQEDAPLATIFGEQVFGRLSTVSAPFMSRIRLTLFVLIESFAEYHSRHPEHLSSIMRFLISGLSFESEAPYAAKALKTLCSECRQGLVSGADWLTRLWLESSSSILPSERPKVVEAICDVIQALSPTEALIRALAIMHNIASSLRQVLNVAHQHMDVSKDEVISLISQLKSCCRGMIVSDEIDLTQEQSNIITVTQAIPLKLAATANEVAVTQLIWNCLKEVVGLWSQDVQVVGEIMGLLSTSFSSSLPLLAPSSQDLVTVLTDLFSRHPSPTILSTVGAFVCTVSRQAKTDTVFASDAIKWIQNICIQCLQILQAVDSEGRSGMVVHPDLGEAFFELMSRLLQKAPIFLLALPPRVLSAIFQDLLMAGLRSEERFTLTAVYTLVLELIASDIGSSNRAIFAQQLISSCGEMIVQQLLCDIESRLPRTQVAKPSEVLFRMISKYPDMCRTWMQTWTALPTTSTRVASVERSNLVKGLLGTRHLKVFKEHIQAYATHSRCLA
ncbi:hypothetical protein SmJEL517_g03188 [Synchytrium microbalum]|uniref:Importin-13 n=1 Tax=Synchytrium microbalum TaxID=1806994 RepID=A0A507BZ09_9FUNG|nr:uncharacterized protein SmJEL517_g03188 [Synchytrium microbalum]TPX34037.1 hypothetical protein SmJEL517_g03188 [Synchytrium microbalum]